MLPYKLIYHPGYDLDLGCHVFPARKYRLIRQRLLEAELAGTEDFIQPEPAGDDDILLVHETGYAHRLKSCTLAECEVFRLELPPSERIARAFWLAAGGTLMAARLAAHDGVGFNIGGGFHHACPDHGEGFCAIHDVAVAIRRLQKDGAVRQVMVVDCDVHQGNGTALIFQDDPAVTTIDLYQINNYPAYKHRATIDIGLRDGTGDAEYLERLSRGYIPAVSRIKPQLLFYLAGADPFREDRLGGLALTLEGLMERDRLVIETALNLGVPVVVTTAGGYAENVEDTVTIHVNTVKAATHALERIGWSGSN